MIITGDTGYITDSVIHRMGTYVPRDMGTVPTRVTYLSSLFSSLYLLFLYSSICVCIGVYREGVTGWYKKRETLKTFMGAKKPVTWVHGLFINHLDCIYNGYNLVK